MLKRKSSEKQIADDSRRVFRIIRTMKHARKITAFPTCVVDTVYMLRVMTVPTIVSTIVQFVPGFFQQYK